MSFTKENLEFTYKDEVAFRGFYMHESHHPWLLVVMEKPYYKVLLEEELFVNLAIISEEVDRGQVGMAQWAHNRRGYGYDRLAKQVMVLDYLNDAAREYVYFSFARSSQEPKYPLFDFLDSDIKDGGRGGRSTYYEKFLDDVRRGLSAKFKADKAASDTEIKSEDK
ncbi:MAG: hypothetical protein GY879_07965 [Planctomycetes bacterium]|nr:hypothetical protein [Planctomycetota bacterium]